MCALHAEYAYHETYSVLRSMVGSPNFQWPGD